MRVKNSEITGLGSTGSWFPMWLQSYTRYAAGFCRPKWVGIWDSSRRPAAWWCELRPQPGCELRCLHVAPPAREYQWSCTSVRYSTSPELVSQEQSVEFTEPLTAQSHIQPHLPPSLWQLGVNWIVDRLCLFLGGASGLMFLFCFVVSGAGVEPRA